MTNECKKLVKAMDAASKSRAAAFKAQVVAWKAWADALKEKVAADNVWIDARKALDVYNREHPEEATE